MSTEIHKSWAEVREQISNLVSELQTWRDYEEEVSYDPEFAEILTTAIDANLALMPLVVPNR
jgi:hypothetical protein